MATSGTIGTTRMTLQQLLDAAFRACRVVPQNVTAEMIENAKVTLQSMLNALPARAVPLWAQDSVLLGLEPGTSRVALPLGSIDVITAKRRSWGRYEGTLQLGSTEHFVDLGTVLDVGVIGFLPAVTGSRTITLLVSDDGNVWNTVYAPGALDLARNRMVWREFEPPLTARYVKVTGVTLSEFADLFVGLGATDLDAGRINVHQFMALPPARSGLPLQYWVDRQADGPVMNVWPKPDLTARYYALSVLRQRHIQDVGSMTQTLEIPLRWEESIKLMLAYRIAVDTPQIDLSVVQTLKPLADEATALIASDEMDASPIVISAGIRGYTR